MAIEGTVEPGSTVGRFQLVAGPPPMLPGKCFSCGSFGSDRVYVDIGLNAIRYGVVYICGPCVVSTANELFGMVLLSVVTDLRGKIENLSELLAQRDMELEGLRNDLAAIDTVRGILDRTRDDSPDVEQRTKTVQAPNQSAPKAQRRATKSAAKSGSPNVPSDDLLTEFLRGIE